MNIQLAIRQLPLVADPHGIIRVTGTRVPLATILRRFRAGETPEEIVLQFDTLALADVYLIVATYLNDRAPFDDYLRSENVEDDAAWQHGHSQSDRVGLRDRLTARRDAYAPVPSR